jgi:hypothetical protein
MVMTFDSEANAMKGQGERGKSDRKEGADTSKESVGGTF